MKLCNIDGCGRKHLAMGWCNAHYRASRRAPTNTPSDLERLEAFISIEPNSGCWLWTASTQRFGYGQFRMNGKTRPAHRASWELHRWPIATDVFLLHVCDVPSCVNPDHLRPGTQRDNMRDMHSKGRARNGTENQTHCHRGHEFTPDNLIPNAAGSRMCRECARMLKRARRAAERAAR